MGVIELEILKDWKPTHLESKNTILRIETDNESLPESARKTIEEITNNKEQFFGLYAYTPGSSMDVNNLDVNYEEHILFTPKYDKPLGRFKRINNYVVAEVFDAEKRFLGYADEKGFYYFKD